MNDAEKAELDEYRRQDLLRHMKQISEDHWAAGWNQDLEHDLYLMTFHGLAADYGMAVVEPARLERMKRLAQLCQIWWVYSAEAPQPTTIPLEEAERRYSKLTARDEHGVVHTQSIPEVKQIYAAAAPSDWRLETISPALKGMSGWQLYRLRTHPVMIILSPDDAAEHDDWELRFGDTTVDLVRPTWAKQR